MTRYKRDEDNLSGDFEEDDEDEPFAIIERLKDKVGISSEEGQSEQGKKLIQENQGLKKLLEINREIGSELDLDKLLEKIMDTAIELTGAERGFLIIKEKGNFAIKIARNFEKEDINKPEFKISYSIAKEVARSGESVLALNAKEDTRFGKFESVRGLSLSSVLCVPFKAKKTVLGVIYLDNRFKKGIFGEWEKYLLTTIASQEAVAIENARLFKDSIRDNVTGLYGHNYFRSRLREEIKRCDINEGQTMSLVLLDIDRFHLINDLLGYQSGNELLREVGETIQQKLRDIDILARFSCDEYELLLPDTNKENAKRVAERIRKAIEEKNFVVDEKKLEVTLSIGLVSYPDDAQDIDALGIKADEALYNAKKQGRNQVSALEGSDRATEQTQKEYIREQGLDNLAFSRDGLVIMGMVNKLISAEADLDQLIDLIASMMVEGTRAERAFVILVDDKGNLEFKAAKNADLKQVDSPEFKISRNVIERVAKGAQSLLITDAREDRDFSEFESVVNLKLKSILCVPIQHKKKIIGLIYIDNNQGAEQFSQSDLQWVSTFAEKIATPIINSWNFKKRGEELEIAKKSLEQSIENLSEKYSYNNIVGQAPAMQKIYQLLEKIVGTHHPVFVHGESGTGKELIAKAIHYNGPRKGKPFVAENCAAISETLLEAELFGYVKGAFTGADKDKKGLFEIADGGSLFLDEVGDMTVGMQKKLLRVLQEGELRRVGGKNILSVDVRIISASNKDLRDLVKSGEFREDLYYRLNVITINMPPLRERKEDIPLLVDYLLAKMGRESKENPKKLSSKALQLMMEYDWPGNVRELGNEISRSVVLSGGKNIVDLDDLSEKVKKGPRLTSASSVGKKTLKEILEECEKEAIEKTLDYTSWNKAKAARILEVSRTTLDKKIQSYDLQQKEG